MCKHALLNIHISRLHEAPEETRQPLWQRFRRILNWVGGGDLGLRLRLTLGRFEVRSFVGFRVGELQLQKCTMQKENKLLCRATQIERELGRPPPHLSLRLDSAGARSTGTESCRQRPEFRKVTDNSTTFEISCLRV